MKNRANRFIIPILLLPVFCLLLSCARGELIAGGSGSTTTNGFIAKIFDANGMAVCNAAVRIRPDKYCASGGMWKKTEVEGTILDTSTTSDGTICVGNLLPGAYTVEVMEKYSKQGIVFRCVISSGKSDELGPFTIKPFGMICGSLGLLSFENKDKYGIQVYGMERIALVDSVSGYYQIDNLPPGKYVLRVVCSDTSFKSMNLAPVEVTADDTVRIDPFSDWLHQGIVTINTASGLSLSDTLYNFPLLLRLNDRNFNFASAKKKGTDLRITKDNGVIIPFETEWWDSANSTAAIWLLIDTLCGACPLKTILIYWGKNDATSIYRTKNVFDTADGFLGVWHLNESGGTEQKDATILNRSGIPQGMDGANDIPGIIGRCQKFEGDSQCIDMGNKSSFERSDSAFSISFWIKTEKNSVTNQSIFNLDNGRFGMYSADNSWTFYDSLTERSPNFCTVKAVYNSWTLINCIKSGTMYYLYVNESMVGSFAAGSSIYKDILGKNMQIGRFPSNSGWLTGSIDEFRIFSQAHSDAWIRFCYLTQEENQEVISFEQIR